MKERRVLPLPTPIEIAIDCLRAADTTIVGGTASAVSRRGDEFVGVIGHVGLLVVGVLHSVSAWTSSGEVVAFAS